MSDSNFMVYFIITQISLKIISSLFLSQSFIKLSLFFYLLSLYYLDSCNSCGFSMTNPQIKRLQVFESFSVVTLKLTEKTSLKHKHGFWKLNSINTLVISDGNSSTFYLRSNETNNLIEATGTDSLVSKRSDFLYTVILTTIDGHVVKGFLSLSEIHIILNTPQTGVDSYFESDLPIELKKQVLFLRFKRDRNLNILFFTSCFFAAITLMLFSELITHFSTDTIFSIANTFLQLFSLLLGGIGFYNAYTYLKNDLNIVLYLQPEEEL